MFLIDLINNIIDLLIKLIDNLNYEYSESLLSMMYVIVLLIFVLVVFLIYDTILYKLCNK